MTEGDWKTHITCQNIETRDSLRFNKLRMGQMRQLLEAPQHL